MPHSSETRLRVRYAETDQMGVAYYSNHLVWMEVARTDFCKSLGFNYTDMEREGFFMAVVEVRCRYLAGVSYDDPILIRTQLDRVRRKVLAFSYAISNEDTGQLIAEGSTVHVTMGSDKKSRPMPPAYLDVLAKAAAEIGDSEQLS